MDIPVLELKNIVKTYNIGAGSIPVVKNVSLKINSEEFISIVGASGSGKSTLLSIMSALDKPTSGDIILAGKNITKLSESKLSRLRGKTIGFVFQTFNLYPTLSVFENIALPLRIHEYDSAEINNKVKDIISKVGLNHRYKHKPKELSGGERQRVAIARALVSDPQIIFADEPTGNLDSKSSQEIIALLTDLNKKHKKTVIIVTHEKEIAKWTNRTIHLKDGQITFDGNTKKYFKEA